MTNGFEDFQKMGKDHVDLAVKSATAVGKGFQALASEAADYSRQSFETGAAAMEKLMSAGSLDRAVEVHTDYMRSAYEGYVGRATRIGEIFAGMTKDAYRPYETLFGRLGK